MWLGLLQEHHVTEKKEEQPAAINAFEIISMSRGLNLENLFDPEQVCVFCPLACSVFVFWWQNTFCFVFTNQEFKRETRITLRGGANEIIDKIEEAAKPLGFDVQKKNYKVSEKLLLENEKKKKQITNLNYYYLKSDEAWECEGWEKRESQCGNRDIPFSPSLKICYWMHMETSRSQILD